MNKNAERDARAKYWPRPRRAGNADYDMDHAPTVLSVTPEILAAALRAYRDAKTKWMISDEDASRMIAEAVLQAAS